MTPGENPPDKQSALYERLRDMRPEQIRIEIHGDGKEKKPMDDETLLGLGEELLRLGKDVVRDEIARQVQDRVAARIVETGEKNKDETAIKMKALGERMKLKMKVENNSPLGRALERATPNVDPKDVAKEKADEYVYHTAAKGFLFTHPELAASVGIDPDEITSEIENTVKEVMYMIRGEKIRDLSSMGSREQAAGLANRYNLNDDQVTALLFICRVVAARKGEVQRMMDKRKVKENVDDKTLQDFVEDAKKIAKFAYDFAQTMKSEMKDASWSERAKKFWPALSKAVKIDVNQHMEWDSNLQTALTQLGLEQGQQKNFMLYYGLVMNRTVSTLKERRGDKDELVVPNAIKGTTAEKKVEAFYEVIVSMQAYIREHAVDYIKLYCHDKGKAGTDKKYADIIDENLRAEPPKMRVKDIVELYIAIQQAEQDLFEERETKDKGKTIVRKPLPTDLGNTTATGGLIMQFKVMELIGYFNPEQGRAFQAMLVEEAALMTANKSSLKLPPHIQEQVVKVMGTAIEYAPTNLIKYWWKSYLKGVEALADYGAGATPIPDWVFELLIHAYLGRKLWGVPKWAINTGIGAATGATEKKNAQRAAAGVSADYMKLDVPAGYSGMAYRAGRAILPGWKLSVERQKARMNDKFRYWASVTKVAGGHTFIHNSAIETAVKLAQTGAPLEDVRGALKEFDGSQTGFTDQQLDAIMQDPKIMGQDVATKAKAANDTNPDAAADAKADIDTEIARLDAELTAMTRKFAQSGGDPAVEKILTEQMKKLDEELKLHQEFNAELNKIAAKGLADAQAQAELKALTDAWMDPSSGKGDIGKKLAQSEIDAAKVGIKGTKGNVNTNVKVGRK